MNLCVMCVIKVDVQTKPMSGSEVKGDAKGILVCNFLDIEKHVFV